MVYKIMKDIEVDVYVQKRYFLVSLVSNLLNNVNRYIRTVVTITYSKQNGQSNRIFVFVPYSTSSEKIKDM